MVSKKNRNLWIAMGIFFLISSIVTFVSKNSLAWSTLLVSLIDFFIAYRENEKIKVKIKEIEEAKIKAQSEKRAQGKNKKKTKKRK